VLAAAAPVAERVRGLVRVGERRWDLMLTKGLRIMLPSERPVEAVEQAVALHRETRALDRDLVALDLRLPERPTLRLHPEADWPPREDAMRLAERDA
jgi:cell division protein FtsQ